MKYFLLVCFFLLQIVSCNFGAIEAKPEATRYSIQNNSSVQLLSVKWNGTNFGDIGSGGVSRKDVSDGNGYVFFEVAGREYRTQLLIVGEKFKHSRFSFVDGTLVFDTANSNIITLRETLNAN